MTHDQLDALAAIWPALDAPCYACVDCKLMFRGTTRECYKCGSHSLLNVAEMLSRTARTHRFYKLVKTSAATLDSSQRHARQALSVKRGRVILRCLLWLAGMSRPWQRQQRVERTRAGVADAPDGYREAHVEAQLAARAEDIPAGRGDEFEQHRASRAVEHGAFDSTSDEVRELRAWLDADHWLRCERLLGSRPFMFHGIE